MKCATLAWHTLQSALEGKARASFDGVKTAVRGTRDSVSEANVQSTACIKKRGKMKRRVSCAKR